MQFLSDVHYSYEHLWVKKLNKNLVRIGLTDFAQHQLGVIIYVDLPIVNKMVEVGQEIGAVESAKSISDLISPIDGQIIQVNNLLIDHPSLINKDPFGVGWLAEVKLLNILNQALLSVKGYRQAIGA